MNKFIKLFLILIVVFLAVAIDCLAFSCNDHAYRDCIGDNIFWYDACSNIQDLYQNCSDYNLGCQYGQCVYKREINYTDHYYKSCYKGDVYWYDFLGHTNDLYQSCSDLNSCSVDDCINAECFSNLLCDGSTCTIGSADYNNYCFFVNCGNGVCEESLGETEISCLSDCKKIIENGDDEEIKNLSISFFVKKDEFSQQWNKSMQIGQNETAHFMIVLSNNFDYQIDGVIVSAEIPNEISYLGNLKVDDIAISGDIVSGIEIGSVQAMSQKTITFEGKTQTFAIQETKNAIAFINFVESLQSDSIFLNFDSTQVNLAGISSNSWQTSLWQFLKRWYMWILAGIVMVFLFSVVFKRISSNV